MYFLRGSLPWQGLKAATNKQKYEKIGEKKQSTQVKDLCDGFPEEFGIYLNYVRKLGFEETPDYDFLRELFAKVMKNNNDVDDGVYDWNLLNGGKGWEASLGQNQILTQIQNAGPSPAAQDRRRDLERQAREDRRRVSQTGGAGVLPPSPALVRHGSKQRALPGAPGGITTPGQITPMSSAGAHMDVPIGTMQRRMSQQHSAQHPYASAGHESYAREQTVEEYSASQQAYGRASPMVSTVGAAPPALSNVRAQGGEVGVSNGGDYQGQGEAEPPKSTLWKILTCRCG